MSKCRKYFLCDCANCFKVEAELIQKKLIVRGYDYEEYQYFIKCPSCNRKYRIRLRDLPIKIAFRMIKKKEET